MRLEKLFASLCDFISNKFLKSKEFRGSESYWIRRYNKGRNSGSGSYGKLANFKAEIINDFANVKDVHTVIEYGCGDGNQLALAKYPSYLGFDVSPRAIELCRECHGDDVTKDFKIMSDYGGEKAELTLSLDVIYHLVEDDIFSSYMERLFDSSEHFVIIYSSNFDDNPENQALHVKHRNFTVWVENERKSWKLLQKINNKFPYKGDDNEGSLADFYIYIKKSDGGLA